MKRRIYGQLLEWKNSVTRKPLILNGARQVGKTYILRQFGESEYRNAESMLVGDGIFSEYKGAFTELYVYTQLKSQELPLYYHSADNSTVEIDFITQWHDKVIPIEVKAEVNVKSKSLRTFISNNPSLHAIRFSMLPYQQQEWLTNIPLYDCDLHWPQS